MALLREVRSGELSSRGEDESVVGASGVFGRGVDSKAYLSPFKILRPCAPPSGVHVLLDAFVADEAVSADSHVVLVLPAGSQAEIRPSVIERISVDMIDFPSNPKVKDEPVEEDDEPGRTRRVRGGVVPSIAELGVPLVSGNGLNICLVNEGDQPLGQRNGVDAWAVYDRLADVRGHARISEVARPTHDRAGRDYSTAGGGS